MAEMLLGLSSIFTFFCIFYLFTVTFESTIG